MKDSVQGFKRDYVRKSGLSLHFWQGSLSWCVLYVRALFVHRVKGVSTYKSWLQLGSSHIGSFDLNMQERFPQLSHKILTRGLPHSHDDTKGYPWVLGPPILTWACLQTKTLEVRCSKGQYSPEGYVSYSLNS